MAQVRMRQMPFIQSSKAVIIQTHEKEQSTLRQFETPTDTNDRVVTGAHQVGGARQVFH